VLQRDLRERRLHDGTSLPVSRALLGCCLLTSAFLAACGSDGDDGGGGSGGTGGGATGNDNCALDITLSGDATLELDYADPVTCITAYTTMPGARVAFGPTTIVDVVIVEFAFPELDPGATVAGLTLPTTIHHADRTQFSPTECVVDITENAFSEATDAGDIYRVGGEGSCAGPGVNGDRSVSVVGTFRFFAPIRWQN
jgi:hypothetical protein